MQYIYYVIYCKKVFCFTSTEFWIWFDIYDWIKSSFQFHWYLNGIVIFLTVWKQSPIGFYTPCWCKEHWMYTWSHRNFFFCCCMCKNGLNFTNDWVCRCSGRLQNHCEKISPGTRVKEVPSLHRYTLVHPNITHIVSESWNKRQNLSPFQIFFWFLSCFSWYPQQCKHIRAVDWSLLWVSLWVFIYCL